MRLCVVTPMAEEISQVFAYYAEQVAAKVTNPGTSIVVKGLNPGVTRIYDAGNSYFRLLTKSQIVEKIIEAANEGFDGVLVHCFIDPGVREGRSVVDIPVVGPGESSLYFACMLGHKFGVVTINDPTPTVDMEMMIREYGLQDRAIARSVRPITMPLKEYARLSPEEAQKQVIPDILDKARECVAEGAEVVVIGCTGLGPLCTLAGVTKIPDMDVPILDCLTVGIKAAESIVDFERKAGLPPAGRVRMYWRARDKDLDRIRTTFGLKR